MVKSQWLAALESEQVEHLQTEARRQVSELSELERDLLAGILAGRSPADQAARLELPLAAVERKIAVVLSKIEAHTLADAVRVAVYAGLGEPDEA